MSAKPKEISKCATATIDLSKAKDLNALCEVMGKGLAAAHQDISDLNQIGVEDSKDNGEMKPKGLKGIWRKIFTN